MTRKYTISELPLSAIRLIGCGVTGAQRFERFLESCKMGKPPAKVGGLRGKQPAGDTAIANPKAASLYRRNIMRNPLCGGDISVPASCIKVLYWK